MSDVALNVITPIDITKDRELRVVATEAAGLREFLGYFDFAPNADRPILNALSSDRGVTLVELIQLFVNAQLATAAANLSGRRWMNCNLNPECYSELGHDGDCDLSGVPF